MAVNAQLLRYSPLPYNRRISNPPSAIAFPFSSSDPRSQNCFHHFLFPIALPRSNIIEKLRRAFAGDDDGNGVGNGGDCGGGGGRRGDGKGQNDNDDEGEEFRKAIGVLGRFLSGWFLKWVVTGDPVYALSIMMKEMLMSTVLIVHNLDVIMYGVGEAIVGGVILVLMAPFAILLGGIAALGFYAGVGLCVCISFCFVFATVSFFMGCEF